MLKCCRNEQNQSIKNFLLSILSTTRNGFSLFSSCQREFVLFFSCFQSYRNAFSARKRSNSHYLNVDFRSHQSLSIIVEKLKIEFFLRKSARNCPQSKVRKWVQSSRFSRSFFRSRSGQFVKDFSTNKSVFFLFSLWLLTTEAMGIWRFAGAFAVVERQSECGSKTAGMHVSQPMNIGVC